MHEEVTALAAGRRHSVSGRSDGSVRAVGNGAAGECNVLGWTDIIAVAAANATSKATLEPLYIRLFQSPTPPEPDGDP